MVALPTISPSRFPRLDTLRRSLPFGLGLGLGRSPSTYTLRVPAPTSDDLRSTPVSLLTVAGRRYAVADAARAAWLADARAAGWGFLRRGRCDERVTLVEPSAAECRSILRLCHRSPGDRSAAAGGSPTHPGRVYRVDGPDTCP